MSRRFWKEGGIIGISGAYFLMRQHHSMALICLVLLCGLFVYTFKADRR